MKQSVALSLVLALFAALPTAGHAQSSGSMKSTKDMETKGMDMQGKEPGTKTEGAVHKGIGMVKKVDTAKSAVTLAHEPIKSLNWSAMTMSFSVKDKALLEKLQTGKKVEFEFVQQGKDNVITSIK